MKTSLINVPNDSSSFSEDHEFFEKFTNSLTNSEIVTILDFQGINNLKARTLAYICHYIQHVSKDQIKFINVNEELKEELNKILTLKIFLKHENNK